MKLLALEARSARELAEFSARLSGEPFRIPAEDLAYNLDRVQKRGDNYSIGLYDDKGGLRGYLLAWAQRSLLQERPGLVLLIEDCCFDQNYASYLVQMLECVVTALERDGREDYAIETVVNPEGLELVAEHEEGFTSLGYTPVAAHQYNDPVLGCTMTWLRYLPVQAGENDSETSSSKVDFYTRAE